MVFHHDLALLVVRQRGILTELRLKKDMAALELAEQQAGRSFNLFVDLSGLRTIRLDLHRVFDAAMRRPLTYAARSSVKSAFYALSADAVRVAKVYAVVTARSPMEVRVFDDLSAAAKWLNVSLEELQLDAGRNLPRDDSPLTGSDNR